MSLAGLLAECFERVCALPLARRQLGRAVLRYPSLGSVVQ